MLRIHCQHIATENNCGDKIEDIIKQQLTLAGIEFICFYAIIDTIYLYIKSKICIYSYNTTINTNSLGFVSWIVNFLKIVSYF